MSIDLNIHKTLFFYMSSLEVVGFDNISHWHAIISQYESKREVIEIGSVDAFKIYLFWAVALKVWNSDANELNLFTDGIFCL